MKHLTHMTKRLAAAGLAAVMLAGCQGAKGNTAGNDGKASDTSGAQAADSGGGSTSGEKRKLEFWESSFNVDLVFLHAAAEIFEEKHPDVEFVISAKGRPEQQIDTLGIAFSSDAGPDLFGYSISSLVKPLIQGGKLEDLSGAFEENGWEEVAGEAAMENQKGLFDGGLYAFPVRNVVMGVFYNKPLFEKLNLEVPSTYDEFIQVCEILQENGSVPIANPGKVPAATNRWFDSFLEKNAGIELHDQLCYGKASLNCPEVVQSLAELKDLSKYFQSGHFSAEENEIRMMLYSGEAAMTYSASWEAGTFEQHEQNIEDWGYFRFPSGLEKSRSNRFNYGVYVNADSPNKDLAMEFLDILASVEPYQRAFDEERAIDVIHDEVIDTGKLDSLRISLVEDAANPDGSYLATNEMSFPPKLTDMLYEVLDKVLLDEITPEEGAKMLDETAAQIGFYTN